MSDALLSSRLDELLASFPPDEVSAGIFLGAQFDLGLAWVHFPETLGGLSLDPEHQKFVDNRLREAGAPTPRHEAVIGLAMGAPVLLAHGTDAQRHRHLRPIFTGEEIWCQLFSEPGAGSDVAGLATAATRDGDDWIVEGQKVWTSYAHLSHFGMLAARTDPNTTKHQGLTYFICDMKAAGVDVRPLRQMTGDAEFNEVFLDGVRIPDTQRVSAVGDGWSVMLTTLMNERVAIGSALPMLSPVDLAIELWKHSTEHDPVMRDRLTRLWIQSECVKETALRAADERGRSAAGADGSVIKLLSNQLNQELTEFCVDLLGAKGMLYGSYDMRRLATPEATHQETRAFLRARANTIEGGTTEVMHTILAERILGLPKELRVDRDVPWRDVPKS